MDLVPKPEPGSSSPPALATTAGDSNLKDMSVSELVTELRTAHLTEEFDAVEEVLVSRFSKLEQVVRPLQDKLECEMLRRKHAEEELNKREEECVRGKKAQDNYEKLLKNVKGAGGLAAKHDVLRKKNAELEAEMKEIRNKVTVLEGEKVHVQDASVELRRKYSELEAAVAELRDENCKLAGEKRGVEELVVTERLGRIRAEEEVRKREEECVRGKKAQENYENLLKNVKVAGGLADKDALGVLRTKNAELELELKEMKEMKNKWVDDRIALAELRNVVSVLKEEKLHVHDVSVELRRKKSELEATMAELRAENHKLAEEKRGVEELFESLERKYGELNGRVASLEEDTRILMDADTGGGNIEEHDDPPADHRASFGVNDEEDIGDYEFGNDTAHHSLGGVTAQTSSKGSKHAGDGKVKLENIEIINLDDSDDENDELTSKPLHGKKTLSGDTIKNGPQSLSGEVHPKKTLAFELLKRKMSSSDSPSGSSSSSDNKLNVDYLTISSASDKRSKT